MTKQNPSAMPEQTFLTFHHYLLVGAKMLEKKVTIKISKDIDDQLKELSGLFGMSKSQIVRNAIKHYIAILKEIKAVMETQYSTLIPKINTTEIYNSEERIMRLCRKIHQMRESGYSWYEIGKQFGMTFRQIHKWYTRNCLKTGYINVHER